MSIVLQGSTSGSITLQEPAVAGTTVLDLPATSGTVLVGGTQNIPKSALPAGSVLQVVQTYKTDTFTGNTSTTYIDVTGLSVTITPSSTSNKILIFGNLSIGTINGRGGAAILVRNSTTIGQADAAGSRARASGSGSGYTGDGSGDTIMELLTSFCYLDSPNTTSATTYKIQASAFDSLWWVNRTQNDGDNADISRWTSNITVMEIAA
jgi:hypothetical protein